MSDYLTLRDVVQRLIDRKIISVGEQEAALAHTPALAFAHPSVADPSSSEPAGFADAGTSGVSSLAPVFLEFGSTLVGPSDSISSISFSSFS